MEQLDTTSYEQYNYPSHREGAMLNEGTVVWLSGCTMGLETAWMWTHVPNLGRGGSNHGDIGPVSLCTFRFV